MHTTDHQSQPRTGKRLTFYSDWNTPLAEETVDHDRHAAYEEFVRRVANEALPWLMPLLDECGASVFAETRTFMFALPSAPLRWLHVPEIACRLNFLPWAERGEIAH